MKQIPNLFTLLNLVFGCVAIVFIAQYQPHNAVINMSGLGLFIGSICILIAAVIDFLDGFVARLFKATSPMGEQLDSLADAVSFGVAPGMIMYKLLENALSVKNPDFGELWWLLPALLIPCAGVWRLAKFNLDKDQRYYFKGLPIPAAGLTIAALPMLLTRPYFQDWLRNPYLLYCLILLISWLMVSNIPMLSLKFKSKSLKDNVDKIIIVTIALFAAVFLNWAAVPLVFVAYVIVSLIFKPNKNLV